MGERKKTPMSASSSSMKKDREILLTKTRLRRGEIGRARREPTQTAQIIDFVPPVHGDVEDILCDLSGGDPNLDEPPDGSDDLF
jgi:hypothetical protein